jgi:telomere length regulation protein
MDELLTPVSTTRRKDASPLLQEVHSTSNAIKKPSVSARATGEPVAKSAGEALEILRHEPGYESLVTTLHLLKLGRFEQEIFHIASPSAIGAQVIHTLVTDIAPNYWTLLQEDAGDQTGSGKNRAKKGSTTDLQLFLACISNVPGINAVLLRLRALTQEAKSEKKDVKRPDLVANLRITLNLLEAVLEGKDCVQRLWTAATVEADAPAKRRPLSQEFLALLGSGRVVSYAAEADEILRLAGDTKRSESARWVINGAEYSRWLGRNITTWAANDVSLDDAKLCSDLLARSLRLGYAGRWLPLTLHLYGV